MRLLVDIVAKQWIEENSHTKAAVWLNTCWEMYKKVPDEPSRALVQGAIDDVVKLSDGIIMIKHDTEKEEKWLQGGMR
jgi:hypothetical protein